MRVVVIAGSLVILLGFPAAVGAVEATDRASRTREGLVSLCEDPARRPITQIAQADRDCIPREQCCKVCSKGKACGNSCIGRSYTCRKGRGCACDAAHVCR